MDTQKKRILKKSLVIVIAAYIAVATKTAWQLHGEKKTTLEAWQSYSQSASHLANLSPNFIYFGKTLPLKNNELLVQVVRARLAVQNTLKSPLQLESWNLDFVHQVEVLDKLNAELSDALRKLPPPKALREHIGALETQRKLHVAALTQSHQAFTQALERYRLHKKSFMAAPVWLWDRS